MHTLADSTSVHAEYFRCQQLTAYIMLQLVSFYPPSLAPRKVLVYARPVGLVDLFRQSDAAHHFCITHLTSQSQAGFEDVKAL